MRTISPNHAQPVVAWTLNNHSYCRSACCRVRRVEVRVSVERTQTLQEVSAVEEQLHEQDSVTATGPAQTGHQRKVNVRDKS